MLASTILNESVSLRCHNFPCGPKCKYRYIKKKKRAEVRDNSSQIFLSFLHRIPWGPPWDWLWVSVSVSVCCSLHWRYFGGLRVLYHSKRKVTNTTFDYTHCSFFSNINDVQQFEHLLWTLLACVLELSQSATLYARVIRISLFQNLKLSLPSHWLQTHCFVPPVLSVTSHC